MTRIARRPSALRHDNDLNARWEARSGRRVSASNPVRATCGACLRDDIKVSNGTLNRHNDFTTQTTCAGTNNMPMEHGDHSIVASLKSLDAQRAVLVTRLAGYGADSDFAQRVGTLANDFVIGIAIIDRAIVTVETRVRSWRKNAIKNLSWEDRLKAIIRDFDGQATEETMAALEFPTTARKYRRFYTTRGAARHACEILGVTATLRSIKGSKVLFVEAA